MQLTDEQVRAIYDEAGASWFFDYNGNTTAPHAALTPKKGLEERPEEYHSEGYVDSRIVLASPVLTTKLIYELVRRLRGRNTLEGGVDIVVSSAYSAIPFGFELARHLAIELNPRIRFEYAEKNPAFETDKTAPRFLCKFEVAPNTRILQAEELITTLTTAMAVRDAVEAANPHGRIFWNLDIACVILRPDSDRAMLATGDIIYLAKKIVKSWPAGQCPLCMQGSPALKPKGENWAKLTGKAV